MNDSAYGELVKDGATESSVGEVAFPGTSDGYLAVVDVFVAATSAPNAKNALGFLATLADPAANLEFNKIKGSVPVLKNVDVASLSPYQQSASEALWKGPVLRSITHGEAMDPAFTQGFFDGVSAFVRTRDTSVFAKKLSEAVNSYRPRRALTNPNGKPPKRVWVAFRRFGRETSCGKPSQSAGYWDWAGKPQLTTGPRPLPIRGNGRGVFR
jgi:hypothetical protein